MSDVNEMDEHYPNFLNKDFVQIKRLDKGAFGKIFVARRKDDSKVYVLKMMFGVTDKDIETIRDEVIVLASINHKNVVRYLDAWIETMGKDEYDKYYNENEDSNESSEGTSEDSTFQCFSRRLNEISSRKPKGNFMIGIPLVDDDINEDDFDEQHWDVEEDNINNEIQWGFDEDLDAEAKKEKINEEFEEEEYEYVTATESEEEISDISEFDQKEEEPIKLSGEIYEKEISEEEPKELSIDKPKTSLLINLNKETKDEGVKVVVIQMEYCSGSNLSRIIESQELHYSKNTSQEKVNYYFKQIITGIQYIHSKNIIHGDLKPANIFRDGDILKIGDFGYATMAKNRNKCKFVGTPGYTAPEVSSGNYDVAIDIYSLGIILLEMCMSCVTRSEFIIGLELLKKRQINETVSKYFPQLSQLILDMTEQDPKQRPDANQILDKISGMEETKRKLEYIKPLLQNHNAIFQSIVNKATYQINNSYVCREQYIQSIKQIEDKMKEHNEKIGGVNCIFYPIIPYKWIAGEIVNSPMMVNSENDLLVVLNNFVDLMKVLMINRKRISTTNNPLNVQIPLYEFGSNDVTNYASVLFMKPSSDESVIFDMCDIFQEVNELMKKCCQSKFKIYISNSQINEIVLRLPKNEQNKLFCEENTMKRTGRSLQQLKKNKVFSNDSSIQTVLDSFIQQIEMYKELFEESVLYYSLNLHTFIDQDPSVITFEVNVNDISVITGGSLRRIGVDSRETAVGYLFNVSLMGMCFEPFLTEEYLKEQRKETVEIVLETPNKVMEQMVGLYFERSGFKVVGKISAETCPPNKKWARVKIYDQISVVTFDEIEFGSTQIAIQINEGNKNIMSRSNLNILDVIEFIREYTLNGNKRNGVAQRMAEFEKEEVKETKETKENKDGKETKEKVFVKNKFIPIIPLQSEYIKMILENGPRTTLNEIQKDKRFDKMSFNRTTEKVKNVNSYIESIAFGITSPKIMLFYSSIDEEYISVVVHPNKSHKI